MLPVKYNGDRDWSPLASFRRELDRLFDDFLGSFDLSWADDARPVSSGLELTESENGYELECTLPGIDPKNVKVEVQGNTLTIRANEEHREKKRRKGTRIRERSSRQFFQSVTLPDTVDPSKINAKLANGVLTVSLPKSETVKPRQIEVKVGETTGTPQLTTEKSSNKAA